MSRLCRTRIATVASAIRTTPPKISGFLCRRTHSPSVGRSSISIIPGGVAGTVAAATGTALGLGFDFGFGASGGASAGAGASSSIHSISASSPAGAAGPDSGRPAGRRGEALDRGGSATAGGGSVRTSSSSKAAGGRRVAVGFGEAGAAGSGRGLRGRTKIPSLQTGHRSAWYPSVRRP